MARDHSSRRDFLVACASLAAAPLGVRSARQPPLISADDLTFLRGLAVATIASATRTDSLAHVGFSEVTPGGNYPAFWVRDFP